MDRDQAAAAPPQVAVTPWSASVATITWWGAAAAVLAPMIFAAGWVLGAHLQPPGYDPVSQTISALAARTTPHRWVMTGALVLTGICQVLTAAGLRPAARPGRLLLGVGGVCTLAVGLAPLPDIHTTSAVHTGVAAVAFAALASWPLASWGRWPRAPWGLRRAPALTAGLLLLAAVCWLLVSATTGGGAVGVAERVAAGGQTVWPCVVALSVLWA